MTPFKMMKHKYLLLSLAFYILACISFGVKLYSQMRGNESAMYYVFVFGFLIIALLCVIRFLWRLAMSNNS